MYFEQPIIIRDTTEALNTTTGAFVLYGGVSVNATYQSTNYSTGAFTLAGGMGVAKNLNVGGATNVAGITRITNTAESVGSGSGALIVDGGVGIAKDLNVAGNTVIFGNLFVAGTRTEVNTETLVVEDNTIVLNSGPAGSRDAGLLVHRSGVDVTDETAVTSGTLAAIAFTSFTLGSAFTENYSGWWLRTTQGSAQVHTYNGTTGTFYTGGNTLGLTPVELGFSLYNRSYIGQYYDESDDEIRFAYVGDVEDPKINLDNYSNYADARMRVLYANTGVSTANLSVSTSATIANLALSSVNVAASTIGTLRVTNSIVSDGPLTVNNNTVLNGNVTAGALNVTGASILQGGITAGSINITGASILQGGITAGSINITGASILQGGITAGSINITGESILQGGITTGALNVTGQSLLNGSVTAGGLNVTGASILQLGITTGALNVTGQSLLNGSVTAGGLNVTGASILQLGITTGALNVTGQSLLNGAVTAGGLAVTGASFFSGNALITGGNLTVTGGSIVFNTVDVSPSMADIVKERSATVGNNVSSPTDVLTFAFDSAVARAFDAVVSVAVSGTSGNSYAYYNLKGVQKDTGNWFINSSFVGDVVGITFSINNGQVRYTTLNKPDFSSGVVKFRALTTSV
jgi:hypothetical protein